MRYSGCFVSDVPATVAFHEKAFGRRLRYMHPSRGYADGGSDMGARFRLTGQLWSTMVADALFASPRPREYLTPEEVDLLIATAQKRIGARTPYRGATPILMAYRHRLRASELCSLRRDMLDLSQGSYHVTRRKNGRPSVHLLRGTEIRDLRRLHRKQVPASIYVFTTERRGPMAPATFRRLPSMMGQAADFVL